jgi:hypothetical protein
MSTDERNGFGVCALNGRLFPMTYYSLKIHSFWGPYADKRDKVDAMAFETRRQTTRPSAAEWPGRIPATRPDSVRPDDLNKRREILHQGYMVTHPVGTCNGEIDNQ